MQQTPIHEIHNHDLLAFMPPGCRKLVEVGCSSGALAREYRKLNPDCHYVGIEIDAGYAELARRHCHEVLVQDMDRAGDEFFASYGDADCWIFGDSLEHLVDPWRLLKQIATRLPAGGHVVACVPNAQHWSVQARLSCGAFRYEDAGLLDRTHLRWFTRVTLIEMFQGAGLRVVAGQPRYVPQQPPQTIVDAIRSLAAACGVDAEEALADAMPFQYVVRAARA